MGHVCDLTPDRELRLSFEAASAGRARVFLRSAVCPAHGTRLLGDAELLVSELVANGLRHGAPPMIIKASCQGDDGLTVSVHDGGRRHPRLRAVDTERESGRGLQIVDHISDSWGVRDDAQGKTTWFRLGA